MPIEEAARGYGCLRVAAPTNNQSKRIRWAADYQLPLLGDALAADLHSADVPE